MTTRQTVVHPRSAPFVYRAGVGIVEESGNRLPILVPDVEEPNILVPLGSLIVGCDHGDSEQSIDQRE